MDFSAWQSKVLSLIPGSMVYTRDLRILFKKGFTVEAAIQYCRNNSLIHKHGSDTAPAPIVYKGGRPRFVGIKRKPLWELAYIEAKIKAAVFAICVEAETHRLESDALEFVRATKKKMAE